MAITQSMCTSFKSELFNEEHDMNTDTCRGALIYNTSASNKAVAVIDFGGDFTVSAGTFTVAFPTADASNALIRLE